MSPILKTLLFTALVPGTVTVAIPYLLLSSSRVRSADSLGPMSFMGFLPIILGCGIYLRCAWDFATAGKGTPAPFDPPRRFVNRGLYRKVRNPMYVGAGLVLLGEVVLFGSRALLLYAWAVALMFHLFVVIYEEPTLKKKFGAEYEEYLKKVPRWIPRAKN